MNPTDWTGDLNILYVISELKDFSSNQVIGFLVCFPVLHQIHWDIPSENLFIGICCSLSCVLCSWKLAWCRHIYSSPSGRFLPEQAGGHAHGKLVSTRTQRDRAQCLVSSVICPHSREEGVLLSGHTDNPETAWQEWACPSHLPVAPEMPVRLLGGSTVFTFLRQVKLGFGRQWRAPEMGKQNIWKTHRPNNRAKD